LPEVAFAGKEKDSIKIIRRWQISYLEESHVVINGYATKFISQEEYRLKSEVSFIENSFKTKRFGSFYLIPEGGIK
jgi:hypothetical protein